MRTRPRPTPETSARRLRWAAVGTVAVAMVILLAALIVLVSIVVDATDAAREQAETAKRQAATNAILVQDLKRFLEDGAAQDSERDAGLDAAIGRIVDDARLTTACTELRHEGKRPTPCAAVNARIDALAGGNILPPSGGAATPSEPSRASTTTLRPTSGPFPTATTRPPGATAPPTTRAPSPTTTPPTTAPAPGGGRCDGVRVQGICLG